MGLSQLNTFVSKSTVNIIKIETLRKQNKHNKNNKFFQDLTFDCLLYAPFTESIYLKISFRASDEGKLVIYVSEEAFLVHV